MTHSHIPEDLNLQQHYCYSPQSHSSEGHRPKLKYERNWEGIAKHNITGGGGEGYLLTYLLHGAESFLRS